MDSTTAGLAAAAAVTGIGVGVGVMSARKMRKCINAEVELQFVDGRTERGVCVGFTATHITLVDDLHKGADREIGLSGSRTYAVRDLSMGFPKIVEAPKEEKARGIIGRTVDRARLRSAPMRDVIGMK